MAASAKPAARTTRAAAKTPAVAVAATSVADTVVAATDAATRIDMNDPTLSAAEAVEQNLKAQG